MIFISNTKLVNPLRAEHNVTGQQVRQHQEQLVDDVVDGVGHVADAQLHGHVDGNILAWERDMWCSRSEL